MPPVAQTVPQPAPEAPPAAAKVPTPPDVAAHATPLGDRSPLRGPHEKRGVDVSLEQDLYVAVSDWRDRNAQTFADCVLAAHLTHGDTVTERLRATDDPRRAELGMTRVTRPLARGKGMGLWITAEGLALLDDAARIVRLSRRAYIHELLREALVDTLEGKQDDS